MIEFVKPYMERRETVLSISVKTGIKPPKVRKLLIENGAFIHKRGIPMGSRQPFAKIDDEGIAWILDRAINTSDTLYKMGGKFGVSRQAIESILVRNGINPRLPLLRRQQEREANKIKIHEKAVLDKKLKRRGLANAIIEGISKKMMASELMEICGIASRSTFAGFLTTLRKEGFAVPRLYYTRNGRGPDPVKIKARRKLNTEIRAGRIKRGKCAICGAPRAHGHHPDYSKPLEVLWLCEPHHKAMHLGKIPKNSR